MNDMVLFTSDWCDLEQAMHVIEPGHPTAVPSAALGLAVIGFLVGAIVNLYIICIHVAVGTCKKLNFMDRSKL